MKRRVAFKMLLKEGARDEYIKRHDSIWPELVEVLKDAGISDYYIFLDEGTGILFASYIIMTPFDDSILSSNEIMKKWWLHMKDLLDTNIDNSPRMVELKEVFNLNLN